ncbi:hypothetical protein [Virgibacillus halodenitrificans]|uniref:hypothetical protein n=1 Tax=Virgibacillus halodenitrificans TaxID=1482 RepID=UPI000EF5219B|nr:hypothetical protein [Virgibacillus halodenitrificans]
MSANISEQVFSLSSDYMVNKIQPCRDKNKFLKDFTLSVTVVKPKEKGLTRNLNLDLRVNSTKEVDDPSYYDNFINYLQYSYDKYVTPLYTNICKVGDVVTLGGGIDEEFYFDNDSCAVSVIISIPNSHKKNWPFYVANKYKELSKLDSYFEDCIFHVREYKVQQVEFKFNFEMETNQTIKYLIENNNIEQEAIGFWLAAFNDVEKKVRKEQFHTNKIPVKRVMTENGPRLRFCDESIKLKL